MTIKTTFIIALLSLSLPAAAEFRTVSLAHEVALSDFRAPATVNGGVVFKECKTCTQKSVRATAETRYAVNGQSMELPKFREAIARVSDREGTTLTVLHHLESDTIVSIKVWIR
jgi:hypothetical protein